MTEEKSLQALHNENERLSLYTDLNPYRSLVIEEVAQHIEKLTGFGQDTISSFAIYIREMKNEHQRNNSQVHQRHFATKNDT